MIRCDRCGKKTATTVASRFNTDMLCPACQKKENRAARRQQAQRAELEAWAPLHKPPGLAGGGKDGINLHR